MTPVSNSPSILIPRTSEGGLGSTPPAIPRDFAPSLLRSASGSLTPRSSAFVERRVSLIEGKTPWDLDPAFTYRAPLLHKIADGIELVESSPIERALVEQLFKQYPIPGFRIAVIKRIRSPQYRELFEKEMAALNARGENPAFQPKWQKDPHPELRKKAMDRLDFFTRGYFSKEHPHLHFMPLFHATRECLLESILKTGFANLATTDLGYFGKGIYGSSSPEYCKRVYSEGYHKGVLLLNWVGYHSAYPIVTIDGLHQFKGRANHGNYDAHFIPVRPRNLHYHRLGTEVVYLPIERPEEIPVFDEFVVFNPRQFLATYIIEIERELPLTWGPQDYLQLGQSVDGDETVILPEGSRTKEELLRQAIALDPKSARAHEALGHLLVEGGSASGQNPAECFLEAITLKPTSSALIALAALEELPASLTLSKQQLLIQALELDPQNATIYLKIAEDLRDEKKGEIVLLGRSWNVAQLYLESLRLNPWEAAAYVGLALSLAEGEKVELPRETGVLTPADPPALYLKALSLDDTYTPAYRYLGLWIASACGCTRLSIPFPVDREMTARELFLEAFRRDKKDTEALIALAQILAIGETVTVALEEEGTPQELDAQQLALHALTLSPHSPDGYATLAATLTKDERVRLPDGTTRSARELLLKALQGHPCHLPSLLGLAALLEQEKIELLSGETKSDQELLVQALELKPDCKRAHQLLAEKLREGETCKIGEKTFDRQALLAEALRFYPKDAQLWDQLGTFVEAGGAAEVAGVSYSKHQLYEQAFRLNPADPKIFAHLESEGKIDVALLVQRLRGVAQAEREKDSQVVQGLHLYIPVKGFASNPHVVTSYREEDLFEMEERIQQFLASGKPVCLIQGGAGSSKTLFARYLEEKLWEQASTGGLIPLYIFLPQIQNPRADLVEQGLRIKGFDGEAIKLLKRFRFLFLLDGYDEIGLKTNLIASNHFNQPEGWQGPVIVNCRLGYLQGDGEDVLFTPTGDVRSLIRELDKAYLVPFSNSRVTDYICKYAVSSHNQSGWGLSQFQKALESLPELHSLMREPFLLQLILSILPTLAQETRASKFSRSAVYACFMRLWFEKETLRLQRAEGLKGFSFAEAATAMDQFASALAFEMQVQKTQVAVRSPFSPASSLIDRSREAIKEESRHLKEDPWERFFETTCKRRRQALKIGLRGGPIKALGEVGYAFMHKSFQEYFAAKELIDRLLELDGPLPVTHPLNRSAVRDPSTLSFILDRIEEDQKERIKKRLMDLVYQSKGRPDLGIGGANALTFLVAARISFSGLDLRGIQAPGAYLYCGLFHRTHLEGACLRGANLQNAFLQGAHLEGVDLREVFIGEYPVLRGHSGGVISVQFSPDGKKIVSGSFDKTIRIWDVETRMPIGEPLIGHTDGIREVQFSPDGRRIVSASHDHTFRIWDVETGKLIGKPLTSHTESVTSVQFSPNGKRIIAGSFDATISIWDAETGTLIGKPLIGHTNGVLSVQFSPDGKRIVSGSVDNTIRMWDAETGTPVGEPLIGHTEGINSACFSPDGKRIISASFDETIRIWDAETGISIGEPLTGHVYAVTSAQFSPDSKKIVSASNDRTIRIWDAETGIPIGEPLTGHINVVTSAQFSPDGLKVVSASFDKTLRIWDVEKGGLLRKYEKPFRAMEARFSPNGAQIISISKEGTRKIWSVETGRSVGELLSLTTRIDRDMYGTFSPDGKRIVLKFSDHTLRVYDAEMGLPVGKPLIGHTDSVREMQFSPDGKRIASVSWDTTLRFWDAETGIPIGEPLMDPMGGVKSVQYSPDGKKIVAASDDHTMTIWNFSPPKPLLPLLGHTAPVNSAQFSPDGRTIVSASDDTTLRIWDAETGMLIGKPLLGHTAPINSAQFSPDGRRVVSCSRDHTLRIWDAETGLLIGEPSLGHMGEVLDVRFSPNGRRIVSGSHDKTLRIWDAVTGRSIGEPLIGHAEAVTSVQFSPDGRKIASASRDRTLKIWDAETGMAIGASLTGHTDEVLSVQFSRDGKNLVSASRDRTLRIWDAETGMPIGEPLIGHTSYVNSAQFSRDGKRIVSSSQDKTLRIWNSETGMPIRKPIPIPLLPPLTNERYLFSDVRFSPSGRRIVSASRDGVLRIWDAETRMPIGKPLIGHTANVTSASFFPDEQRIVSASADGTLRIWDVETGMSIGEPLIGGKQGVERDSVSRVAFAPDGKRFISGSSKGVLKIWDAESRMPIGEPLIGPAMGWCSDVRFSPDGKRVVSINGNSVIVWKEHPEGGWLIEWHDESIPFPFNVEGATIERALMDDQTRALFLDRGASALGVVD